MNIKILLNQVIAAGDLAMDARNVLLSEMTHEVSELVLRENYLQTRVVSVLVTQSMRSFELYNRYLNALEGAGKLDRALDFIPSEKEFLERKLVGKGLTNPEIAVLLRQSKIHLKGALLASDLLEDPYLTSFLSTSFPLPLQQRFHSRLQTHPLRREIIATKLSNLIMNEVGFTFVYRLQDETGASASSVMRAYIIARAILGMDAVWREIELLPPAFDAKKQMDIVMHCGRLLRRTTRWFLRTKRVGLDMSAAIERYLPGIMEIKQAIPHCFGQAGLLQYHEVYDSYINEGIPKALAHVLASIRGLFSALDIIGIAEEQHLNVTRVADAYFFIGEYLELTWLRSQVIIHTTESYWEALSREILRDDLDLQQRQLTSGVIRHGLQSSQSIQACFEDWTQEHTGLMARWRSMLTNLKSSATLSYTMYFVTIRELLDFTQMVIQVLQENDR